MKTMADTIFEQTKNRLRGVVINEDCKTKTTLADIKPRISQINRNLADVKKIELTQEERAIYNVESDLVTGGRFVLLYHEEEDPKTKQVLLPRQLIFWTQGSSYKNTLTSEELNQVVVASNTFRLQCKEVETLHKLLDKAFKDMTKAELGQEASPYIAQLYQNLITKYLSLEEELKRLLATVTAVKEKVKARTVSQPEKKTKVTEESHGNEEFLNQLFKYLSEDLLQKQKQGELTPAILTKSPGILLVEFMQSVLESTGEKYPSDVVDYIERVVWNLGGEKMLTVAFNTEPAKRYGVLKTKLAKECMQNLSLFLNEISRAKSEQKRIEPVAAADTPSQTMNGTFFNGSSESEKPQSPLDSQEGMTFKKP